MINLRSWKIKMICKKSLDFVSREIIHGLINFEDVCFIWIIIEACGEKIAHLSGTDFLWPAATSLLSYYFFCRWKLWIKNKFHKRCYYFLFINFFSTFVSFIYMKKFPSSFPFVYHFSLSPFFSIKIGRPYLNLINFSIIFFEMKTFFTIIAHKKIYLHY